MMCLILSAGREQNTECCENIPYFLRRKGKSSLVLWKTKKRGRYLEFVFLSTADLVSGHFT